MIRRLSVPPEQSAQHALEIEKKLPGTVLQTTSARRSEMQFHLLPAARRQTGTNAFQNTSFQPGLFSLRFQRNA
jgi:hypothetical protein